MTDAVLELVALLVYGPLVVLLHESGHALLARLGGFRVTSFGVGLGRPLWSLRLAHGVVLHVDEWVLAGGACVAVPTAPPGPRRAWFHAGGLLFQLGLALVLALLPDVWLVDRVERFNLLVAVTNALPWKLGGAASDGWQLLDVLLGGRRSGETIAQRAALERMAAREEAVGSPVGAMYARVCLAWIDVLVNRASAASPFFAKNPPESALDPWIDALYHYVHAEWHRAEGRALAALRTVRETRAALGRAAADDSVGLLTIAEARALLDLDAADTAMRALSRVSGLGGPIGRQATAVHLAAILEGDADELEFATWRVVRRVHETWLDPADTASVLWQAADRLEGHLRIHAARGARDAARLLARRVLSLADSEDRPPLTRRIGPAAGYVVTGTLTGEAER